LKMELELKQLKLNPVTVTVTPVFPVPWCADALGTKQRGSCCGHSNC